MPAGRTRKPGVVDSVSVRSSSTPSARYSSAGEHENGSTAIDVGSVIVALAGSRAAAGRDVATGGGLLGLAIRVSMSRFEIGAVPVARQVTMSAALVGR